MANNLTSENQVAQLLNNIKTVIEQARTRVKQTVNSAMVQAYWLENTDAHPLIASCVFHYEFEFIHPFSDGNGRMGRLWQTLILSKWHEVFINIPVESMVHQHQEEYYLAISNSTNLTDASPFIEFMLKMILSAIESSSTLPKNEGLKLTILDQAILSLIAQDPYITNAMLADKTGKSLSSIERRIRFLKDNKLIERVGAKKTGYWRLITRA